MSYHRHLAIAAACALLAGLPFLNKAFTIDDTPVLTVAQQITVDPLRPFSCEINWRNDPEPMFEVTTNPPMLSYVLAPLVAGWGLNEVILHIPMVVFLLILAVAMVALSVRFTSGSLWPLLFVLSTPAVVVSSNLMRDVPAMALSAASVAAFVWGSDRGERRLLALGAALAGFAMLTKYSSLMLFGVLGAYPLLRRRPRDLVWLVIPAAMVGLWSLQNVVEHGRTHIGFLGRNRFDEKGFSRVSKFLSLTTIVGSLIWLWPVACVHDILRRGRLRVAGWALAPVLSVGLYLVVRPFEPRATVSFFLWATAGMCLLAWILWEATHVLWARVRAAEGTDTFFLLWWLVCCLGAAVFVVFFQAVRHLLPALPALVLLVVVVLRRSGLEGRLRPVLIACVVMQIGLSVAIGVADAQFADATRAFIRDKVPRLREAGSEIWFCGNWGFRTYAEAAGLKDALFRPPAPPEGSLLIWPVMTHKSRFNPELKRRLILREEHPYKGAVPIRTMSPKAGFYSTVRWKTPFRLTTEPKEIIRVYEVGPAQGKE
ncbi:MAG: glycosyltransferase family 39 protein [Acidobacteria bacterium]|nr:glycosyltransferase family 39 protein [Acidobacteriota bacterium]